MPGLKRRATAGVIWSSVESWGQQLLQFSLFALLARLLGPEAFGIVAMAMILTTFANLLVLYGGWNEALVQRPDLDPRHTDSAFWALLGAALVLTAIVAVAARPLAAALAQPSLAAVTAALGLSLPLGALGVVPAALLRREFRFAPLALRTLFGTVAAGLVAVPMALAGYGVWSLVAFQLAIPAIQTAVLWRAHPWRPGLRVSWPHLRELGGYVAGVLGERSLLAVEIVVPRLVVGAAAGAAPLGHFTTARKILDLMIDLLVKPVTQVAMPSFAGTAADTARVQTVLTVGTQVAALLVFPGHVGLILVAPDLVPLIFGAAWSPAVPVLQVMALSGLALPFVMLTTALMHGTGHTTAQLGVTVLATAVFVLLLLAMPQADLALVALAYVLRSAILLPVRLWTVRRVTGIDPLPSLRGTLPLALATALMAASVLVARHAGDGLVGPLAAVLRDVAVGGLVYVAAVALLGRRLVADLAGFLRSLARPRGAAADGGDVAAV